MQNQIDKPRSFSRDPAGSTDPQKYPARESNRERLYLLSLMPSRARKNNFGNRTEKLCVREDPLKQIPGSVCPRRDAQQRMQYVMRRLSLCRRWSAPKAIRPYLQIPD